MENVANNTRNRRGDEMSSEVKTEFKNNDFFIKVKEIVKSCLKPNTFSDGEIDSVISLLSQRGVNPLVVFQAFQDQNIMCKKCGECCRCCDPIDITPEEVKIASQYLGIPTGILYSNFIKEVKGRFSRRFSLRTPCPMLTEQNLCRIHPVRPYVCKAFPFGYTLMTMVSSKTAEMAVYCFIIQKVFALEVVSELIFKEIGGPPPEFQAIVEFLAKKYEVSSNDDHITAMKKAFQIQKELDKIIGKILSKDRSGT